MAWYLHASMVFAYDSFLQTVHNLHNDGQLFRSCTWGSAVRTWFGPGGLAWHLAGPVRAYLSPRFHPWRHVNRQLIETWLERNSGAWRPVRGHGT